MTWQPIIGAAAPGSGAGEWLAKRWGGTTMAVHGRLYDLCSLATLTAVVDGELVGALTYVVDDGSVEIVSCDAGPPGRGTGRALVEALVDVARDRCLEVVWCTTTNDNLPALGFWQVVGFRIVRLRLDAVREARRLKPGIPESGWHGIPVRDEIDLERRVAKLREARAQR